MGTVDSITGLIAPVVAAGVTMKIADSMFGTVTQNAPRRKVKRKAKKACKKGQCRKSKKHIKGQTALPHGHKNQGDLYAAVFGPPRIRG